MVLTRKELEDYMFCESEIDRLERKIDKFSRKQPRMEHGVVKGSMPEFPYAECHFTLSGSDSVDEASYQRQLRQLLVTLQQRKAEFERKQVEIGAAIENINDPFMRQVIEYKYVQRMTDAEIGDLIGAERSTISKAIKNFFEKSQTFT